MSLIVTLLFFLGGGGVPLLGLETGTVPKAALFNVDFCNIFLNYLVYPNMHLYTFSLTLQKNHPP